MLSTFLQHQAAQSIDEVIKDLDMAILLGAPPYTEFIHTVIEALESREESNAEDLPTTFLQPQLEQWSLANNAMPIERVECPSLHEFYSEYMQKSKPVILTNVMKNWPAFNENNWHNVNYLRKTMGKRLVPIEIGENYVNSIG